MTRVPPLARLAAIVTVALVICAARTALAADGLVIPHVGIDETLHDAPVAAPALRAAASALGGVPVAVRLSVRRSDLAAGDQLSFAALETRLA